jgi:hypothetical protein
MDTKTILKWAGYLLIALGVVDLILFQWYADIYYSTSNRICGN